MPTADRRELAQARPPYSRGVRELIVRTIPEQLPWPLGGINFASWRVPRIVSHGTLHDRSIRCAEPRACIPAGGGHEVIVVALRDVAQCLRLGVELRVQKADWSAAGFNSCAGPVVRCSKSRETGGDDDATAAGATKSSAALY
jgi:hypothetical protein